MRKAFKLALLTSILLSVFSLAWGASIVRDFNVSNYKGRWVVISYWATWCGYCRGEIPELNAFYRAHADQVAMFGFNYDDPGNLSQHIQEMGVIFPTLVNDPKANFGIHGISGLPTTLVIGPDGRLKHVLEGPQTNRSLERAVGL
ncbi:MAG: putative thiol-disulfide oxidoreductase [Pseudomonadota bacterium]|jgi:thiol-disulfide isomerase/thioredoxin